MLICHRRIYVIISEKDICYYIRGRNMFLCYYVLKKMIYYVLEKEAIMS